MSETSARAPTAFSFHGSWTDFAKIALPNVLLTVVTLGIYRFWATTRERRYLWGQTRFIDEPLEWTGRGIELFWGFVMVFFLVGLPLVIMQLALQGMIFQGQTFIVAAIVTTMAVFTLYLTGVAYFRTLRYRLSRTYWRGIRGGSHNPGFPYGLSYLWKNGLPYLPGAIVMAIGPFLNGGSQIFFVIGGILLLLAGLFYPWSSMSLWNERWSHMSFGPYHFESNANWTDLLKRYLLFYLVPFMLFVGFLVAGVSVGAAADGGANPMASAGGVFGVVLIFLAVLGLYIVMPIAALMYYSKFFRVAVSALKLGNLEFEFKARSPDWILYWLANIAIMAIAYSAAFVPFSLFVAADPAVFAERMEAGESVVNAGFIISALLAIIPVAFGSAIIQYRNWKFFVTHMEAFGEVNLDQMTQSDTQASAHGEGLLDAFDMGAI